MKITNFSIARPVFTMVTMALFLLLGFVSLTNIPLKLIPDIDPPIAAVVTSYDDAGPEEVVEQISRPMEQNLSTVGGLNNISTISMEGQSLTILEFSWTTSIDDVENDIITSMNQVPLPNDAGQPQFIKFDPAQFPIIQLSLSSDNGGDMQALVEDLERDLLRVDGVATIDLMGDAVEEISVTLDQEALEENNLVQSDIVQVLQTHNITAPGGVVEDGGDELTTRVLFELGSLEDIENIVVTETITEEEETETVTLSEVAEVERGPEPTDIITRTNQEDAILLSVQQQADANTAGVASEVMAELDELLETGDYEDLQADVLFNQGEFIEDAISNVALALIGGGIIAMVVLFFFLRSFKTPLLIGIAIPFSVIVTFVLLYFTNFSLNIMTLGGLALGIGMLVDNSIVVIENIYRHLSMKKSPRQAAADGTKEVATAITASTLTTISVFLPVVFISGIVGNLFREFALTVSFSLLASLAVALTVVPMIASRWLKAPKEDVEEKRQKSRFITFFDKTARWSLKNRMIVFLVTVALLIAGGFGITTVGTQFLPATDESFLQIEVENETGTPLDTTFEDVQAIEEVLDEHGEIEAYTSVTGSGGDQGPMAEGTQGNQAVVYVTMVPVGERDISTIDFGEEIRRDVENAAPDAEVNLAVEASFGGDPNTFSFDLTDQDPVQLQEVAEDLLAEFEDMPEFTEVTNTYEETTPELQVLIDEEAAREEGLTPAEIAEAVDTNTRGAFATQIVTEQNDVLEVNVRLAEEFTEDVEALEDLLLRNQEGEFVALNEVADIERGEGPETINRINQEESVQFSLTYSTDYNLGEINQLVDDTVEDYGLPSGTTLSYTGDQQLLDDAISDLTLALILAVVFVYFVMAAQFESLKYPLVVMFTVPLVLIGVTLSLTLTRTPISVTAFIGLIVLVGIVVNNSIVLVDYINRQKEYGLKSYDAIVEGVKDRARPILMTASTTILALIPLAMGLGEGSEIQQPLAITVIGGMVSATFLTLVLIPVVYSFFDKETRNLNKKYMTPDGQIVPAYLLEDSYRKEDGASRKHFSIESEDRPLDKAELNDFYKGMDDELDPAFKEATSAEEAGDESEFLTERREDKDTSKMSKEELLEVLEELIKRNKKE
ncbi:efflux RND transporter permease subunit [Alkalicoccus daliensis]|uniref:Hydrophobic/amphiphilic exporter-1, HAE1 family n=1 Tax=Alkalicoccus daliensis TaxID=745820 RepID=A0A1H0CSG3_9BACI|nr:efflux RND transporter permease subunit [Alkalicoccus daliensis]SDN60745.1 hydrophobic/amphiphilic exporter-1, HAE1 family [Alkalicoccus daliensis]